MDLGVADKMAVMYLFAKCDAVGVWVPNYKLANFQLGAEVDWETLPEKCNGNIEVLANGKWWLKDFCEFQYGALREECKPHASYLSLLRKHGLEGYPKGMHTLKEKETEKEKEEELEKEKDKELYHAVEAAFLSRNGDRFTNYGKEGRAIHGLVEKARGRLPDDPGAMMHAMLDAFWKLKAGDTTARGFWRDQPFLPSALSPLWDRVLETMREDVVSPELLAIVNGGKT
jgi:hypothetical protein